MTPLRYTLLGVVICTLVILLIAGARNALGQAVCAPPGQLLASLAEKGLKVAADLTLKTKDGALPMRIVVNPKSGAWMLITFPDAAVGCVVLVGDKFEPARLPGVPL